MGHPDLLHDPERGGVAANAPAVARGAGPGPSKHSRSSSAAASVAKPCPAYAGSTHQPIAACVRFGPAPTSRWPHGVGHGEVEVADERAAVAASRASVSVPRRRPRRPRRTRRSRRAARSSTAPPRAASGSRTAAGTSSGVERPQQQPLGAGPARSAARTACGSSHIVTLDGVPRRGSTENYPSRVKTFEQLWAELADKAEHRPEGSGTVAAARRRRARDRQEARGGGGRVVDGRRARVARARRRGDQPAALPRAGADARACDLTLDDVYAHL